MSCPHCIGSERIFDEKNARRELKNYRKKGPDKTTRWLIESIQALGSQGRDVLDVGAGVGAIHLALLNTGSTGATVVDASQSYLQAAEEEATRQGYVDRIRYHYGDFNEIADRIQASDIVTLDRVICCYPDADGLLRKSSERAKHVYGLVYPRDTWWMKIGMKVGNLLLRLQRNPFRVFVHSDALVESILQANGFFKRFYRRSFLWQVVLYARVE